MSESNVINVGVIGLGMMGRTHLDVYSKRADVKVVAVSDLIPARLEGRELVAGNVEGQAQSKFDTGKVARYSEGMQLIADKNIQLVDICLPTPLHVQYASAALAAGKHVMLEKPIARHSSEIEALTAAVNKGPGMIMIGMCLRFWPGWTWLKEAVEKKTYGKVLSAQFRRVANHPGGEFYLDGDRCGGAVLDLHVHDVDFIQYLFGTPKSVFSRGYSKITNKVDHILTHYLYDNIPLVTAEGGWAMTEGFGFNMQFTVNFERATSVYDMSAKPPMKLFEAGKAPATIELEPVMGYEREIEYFLNCIRAGKKPTTVTVANTAPGIKIVEAEVRSVASGKVEQV